MAHLTWNRYGKCGVRLVKVRRSQPAHDVVDLTLDVQLEGAFDAVYTDGDNATCLATDTMKNTIYALARQDPLLHIESFARRLASHFVAVPNVSDVRIGVVEHPWTRLSVDGRPHPHAFAHAGGEQWTTVVTDGERGVETVSGVSNLVLLKTSDSSFAGFPRDVYTTLPETDERLLATSVTAAWTYRAGTSDFTARERIRRALVETFAAHDSRSVQHTLYAMGEATLAACADVTAVTLTLPNRHHLLVNLEPFGLDNANDVFVATDRPFGLIEATIRR